MGLGRLVRGIKKETGWRYAFVHPDNTFVHPTRSVACCQSIPDTPSCLLFYTDVVPHYKLSNDSWPPWDSLRPCTLWTSSEWERLVLDNHCHILSLHLMCLHRKKWYGDRYMPGESIAIQHLVSVFKICKVVISTCPVRVIQYHI